MIWSRLRDRLFRSLSPLRIGVKTPINTGLLSLNIVCKMKNTLNPMRLSNLTIHQLLKQLDQSRGQEEVARKVSILFLGPGTIEGCTWQLLKQLDQTIDGSANCGSVTLHPMLSYTASGAHRDRERRFVEVGWGFSGIPPSSQALRWRVPRMILGAAVPSDAWCNTLIFTRQ
jgi:hypothetical protein